MLTKWDQVTHSFCILKKQNQLISWCEQISYVEMYLFFMFPSFCSHMRITMLDVKDIQFTWHLCRVCIIFAENSGLKGNCTIWNEIKICFLSQKRYHIRMSESRLMREMSLKWLLWLRFLTACCHNFSSSQMFMSLACCWTEIKCC